jgi:hypothetical protein
MVVVAICPSPRGQREYYSSIAESIFRARLMVVIGVLLVLVTVLPYQQR